MFLGWIFSQYYTTSQLENEIYLAVSWEVSLLDPIC